MGNVPISCCRSKSPRSDHDLNRANHYRDGSKSQYLTNQGRKFSAKHDEQDSRNHPSNNLQHISEREPDDSETDPSSNPLNRPIFAARSSFGRNRSGTYNDSYSSTNSTSRRLINTPLTSSQDHGYNSGTSTNLTHYDTHLNDSFETNIQQPKQPSENQGDNRLPLSKSPSTLDDTSYPLSLSKEDCGLNHVAQDKASDHRYLQKSSSCSTIYIDNSTISQPNLEQTIKCVSLAIYYHIKNRTSDYISEIFDESIHPLKMPTSNTPDTQDGLHIFGSEDDSYNGLDGSNFRTIYSFVKTLFNSAQLTSEYAITTLVYLERLMTYAEMDLNPKTWRRMFLGAILLSSKVWEDQAVWNVDYAQILEEISVEDINELERQFLEMIQFNMNVPSSVYAKYYFHLRTLALQNGLSEKQALLTVGKAKNLEAMSRTQVFEWEVSPIHRKSCPTLKMYTSLEKLRTNGLAKAVLM